jgi:hypothetical protein
MLFRPGSKRRSGLATKTPNAAVVAQMLVMTCPP